MVYSVLVVLVAMTTLMLIGWVYQRAVGNGGWTDVFWTLGTGLTCAAVALAPIGSPSSPFFRRALVAAMLAIWSLRLGLFVAFRVAKGSEDVRYAQLREAWGSAFQRNMLLLALCQGPVTAILSVSVLLAAEHRGPNLRLADVAAVVVFVLALAGEAVADRQMSAFRSDPANKGQVCDKGLWAWSRHPNYFFEAVIWISYTIIGFDLQHPWSLLSAAAPVTMWVVVRFGTGVPALEAAMIRSKGDAYRRYQSQVSPLLPRPRHG